MIDILPEIEKGIADKIVGLSRVIPRIPLGREPDIVSCCDYNIDRAQLKAIIMGITESICIITGGPGTGKTTAVLSTILNIFDKRRVTYAMCAPTGKAAIRMDEACNRFGASTLHRKFGLMGDNQYDLKEDVLVIDEASMVSDELLYNVLQLVPVGKRIIFIGDSDQLPPIGLGEPLYQMLQTRIPSVRLSTIYRQQQGNGIVNAATLINSGISPTVGDEGFSISFCDRTTIVEEVVKSFNMMKTVLQIPESDIQILTPVNKGFAGQETINPIIQCFMTGEEGYLDGYDFRLGDRVINTRNNYDLGVMNGEVGIIKEINPDGDKLVMAFGKTWNVGSPIYVWVDYPNHGSLIGYSKENLSNLQLAYATTIHKSQGSEYEGVILIMPYTNDKFYLRQLPYTGITRAVKWCHMIVTGNAIDKYVATDRREERKTNLAELINERM